MTTPAMRNPQSFNTWLLYVIIIILSPVAVFSQNLAVKKFETATLDLSARTNPIKDANREDCALLKIFSPDAITKVEGNVVKEVDNAGEHWIYLSPGTRNVRIFTSHHSPITVNFHQFINSGVSSQSTYLLELQSDLPVEILYGTTNPLSPVRMSGAGSDTRPAWWNTDEAGLYVGISCPSYDGESAKLSAISNAITLYAQSIGAEVVYTASVQCENDSTEYKQMYKLSMRDFDIRILQEYYNPDGEYFVLCKFSRAENNTNKFACNWYFFDDEKSGYLSYESEFLGKINISAIHCHYNYSCDWNQDNINFAAFINDNRIFEKKLNISAIHDNLTDMKLCGGTGFNQLRLISSLPCLPDSVSINSTTQEFDNGDSFALYMITGSGISVPREYKILECDDDVCTFSIPERFPAHKSLQPLIPAEDIDKTGLSSNYFRDYGFAADGFAKSISLEHNKNVAFLNSIPSISRQMYSKGTEKNAITGFAENAYTRCAIYPLWYLDSAEKTKYRNRKHKSDWERYQSALESQVRIILPK